MSAADDAWLEIGKVVSVNAGSRNVRIGTRSGCVHELEGRDRLWLQQGSDPPFMVRIARMRADAKSCDVVLTPGISRDKVTTLKFARVLAPLETRRARPSTDWRLDDLVEMDVATVEGLRLGVVFETIETPGGGVIRLRLENGTSAALPWIDALIHSVDKIARIITVNDPEPYLVRDDAYGDE
jgi:ribosomal 30S subunit maturation factor RimM